MLHALIICIHLFNSFWLAIQYGSIWPAGSSAFCTEKHTLNHKERKVLLS